MRAFQACLLLLLLHMATADHMDELLGLSELPLQSLLHVQRAFQPAPDDEEPPPEEEQPTSAQPAALPLVGHSKRVNPLVAGRPTRRGGGGGGHGGGGGGSSYGGGGGGGGGKGKGGKKGSISKIFQMSVTALAFLAFGGYLLCLIVRAVRAGNGSMMNGALQVNSSRLVYVGVRPGGRRRRRDLPDSDDMFQALLMLSEGYALYDRT